MKKTAFVKTIPDNVCHKSVLSLDSTFLLLFLGDADSRKGTRGPFCVPIHRKKKNLNKILGNMSRIANPRIFEAWLG